MTRFKKVLVNLIVIVGCYAIWCQSYRFDAEKASVYITKHALAKSTHCCAWYTMRALQAGGCPAVILPAQWYRFFMPLVKFDEISKKGYRPQKGDVVVFERPSGRSWKKISQWWGHIAMYDGRQWVSDFKQKHMNPYRYDVPYRLYRYGE